MYIQAKPIVYTANISSIVHHLTSSLPPPESRNQPPPLAPEPILPNLSLTLPPLFVFPLPPPSSCCSTAARSREEIARRVVIEEPLRTGTFQTAVWMIMPVRKAMERRTWRERKVR